MAGEKKRVSLLRFLAEKKIVEKNAFGGIL